MIDSGSNIILLISILYILSKIYFKKIDFKNINILISISSSFKKIDLKNIFLEQVNSLIEL